MKSRNYTLIDQFCLGVDQAFKTLFGKPDTTDRKNPASQEPESNLSIEHRKQSAGMMRVNHCGEVCAQALYHAQGLISKREDIKIQMKQAAIEEGDHLAWCRSRLTELGSHTSYLNPLWYAGSFAIGLAAGLVGDKWNLGFLAETEHQVVQHLQKHLKGLPKEDIKSQKILLQMCEDEAQHRDEAYHAGAEPLPDFIKQLMRFSSKIMVTTAYWV